MAIALTLALILTFWALVSIGVGLMKAMSVVNRWLGNGDVIR